MFQGRLRFSETVLFVVPKAQEPLDLLQLFPLLGEWEFALARPDERDALGRMMLEGTADHTRSSGDGPAAIVPSEQVLRAQLLQMLYTGAQRALPEGRDGLLAAAGFACAPDCRANRSGFLL